MRTEKDKPEYPASNSERREFISRFGKVGLGVPATALLVSLAGKRARASAYGYEASHEEWGEDHDGEPSIYTQSYGGESDDDWTPPRRRGSTIMRSYDRGGVSEIMDGDKGGKGDTQ
jgi:hypothetical protein